MSNCGDDDDDLNVVVVAVVHHRRRGRFHLRQSRNEVAMKSWGGCWRLRRDRCSVLYLLQQQRLADLLDDDDSGIPMMLHGPTCLC